MARAGVDAFQVVIVRLFLAGYGVAGKTRMCSARPWHLVKRKTTGLKIVLVGH